MNISYDNYRIFYYVARHRSLTAAAVALGSNQPNITRAIKNMEAALGCTLFIRSRSGVMLTPEGEKLYAHISLAMEHIQAGEEELSAHQSLTSGTVTVAVSDIAMHCCLLPALKQYRAEYPGVHVRLSGRSTLDAIEMVRQGLADFAVVTEPFTLAKTLRFHKVMDIQETAVCGGAYASLAQAPLTCEELLRYPLVGLGTRSVSYSFFSHFFSQQGLRYHLDIEAASAEQILPLVQNDLGIGFVPEAFLDHIPAEHSAFVLPLTEKPPRRGIFLVTGEKQTLSIAAKTLEKMLM